jgi:ADP-ribosylglycohydrolase
VHPGVASLWEFHQAGDPARIAERHDGCGAAIRVAPVGILFQSHRLEDIVSAAREASIPTHGGTLAIAAAAATAAAVSAAIDGKDAADVLDLAVHAASLIERERSGSATLFADAVRRVHDEVARTPAEAGAVAAVCFPDSPLTIVPLALALATIMQSAEEAILLAANVGGDSDSVASIASGILGARHPATVNREWLDVVERVNSHGLANMATSLATLRHNLRDDRRP